MDLRGMFAQRIEAGQSVDRAEEDLLAAHPALSEEQRAVLWLYARYPRKGATPLLRGAGGFVHEALPAPGGHAR
jgi:hypothetical protein